MILVRHCLEVIIKVIKDILIFLKLLSHNQIFLYDKDKNIANMLCYADTDPRMQTFDGEEWTASLAGEFVMYRDSRRLISVSTEKFSYTFCKAAKMS